MPTPFVENQDVVATIYSADTLDEAVQGAIHRLADFLTGIAKMPLNDAGMLMSVAGALKFCQIVDPKRPSASSFPRRC